ncbi:MacS family sensor histidine kinase [Streptomyces iconiensis]|uniref:DUF5931 domain-containing protein n=1 Tax=Streptomyces iconiensis TaxID=1384038 RepID=A0ABT7A224_9ACTN|nr:DUF5931 domain-containing protein [Streptomyces iconiensis]MDJ1135370.1 DUF5931 domain-containing protein [Streptomyces iconiensis]
MSVEQPLWHALTGYRVLTVLYALVVFGWAYDEYSAPVPGGIFLGALTVWTFTTLRNVQSAARCTPPFLVADMGFAVVGILISPLIDAHDKVGPTLPSIWVAGPVLAFALKGGWRWAAGASLLVGIANVIERGMVTRPTLHNVLLVCVASVAIGYVVEVARASERTLARALQIEAATRERERLARDIHDSVLQVLAMVQRRGTAIGGEAAELGRMAGEQEVALRTLVSSGIVPHQSRAADGAPDGLPAGDAAPNGSAPGARGSEAAYGSAQGHTISAATRAGTYADADSDSDSALCDIRALLSSHSAARVSFAEPGAPVLLPARVATELTGAVSAALDNVRRHARGESGEEAHAWILLEDEPGAVIVTVRDDGPGIPAGRLADAEAEGRMGVALSIRGRLRDLGGTADLVSVPGQGTEVELRVPKRTGGAEA